jgi:hypothetical protein
MGGPFRHCPPDIDTRDVESCSRELGLISGYVAGAAAGLFLVSTLSSNTHDTDLETVMTAAFVTDPLGDQRADEERSTASRCRPLTGLPRQTRSRWPSGTAPPLNNNSDPL